MKWFFYSLKEIFNNKKFCRLFVLNIALGLTGFMTLEGFKDSLEKTIKQRSKSILGADFGISARRPMKPDELEIVRNNLPKNYKKTLIKSLFSMVGDKNTSRLTHLKAIDSSFPFYGKIELRKHKALNEEVHQILKESKKVIVYPEIVEQFDLKIGSIVKVGEVNFQIYDVIEHDPTASITNSMAPRIYFHQNHLQSTGLIKPGSLVSYSHLFKFETSDIHFAQNLKKQIFSKMTDPDVRVFTHEDSGQQVARMMTYLNDFLSLTSLVALFLAILGTAYLLRDYLSSRTKEVAVLLSLGASHIRTFLFYLYQVVTLSLIGGFISLFFSHFIIKVFDWATKGLTPFEVSYAISTKAMFIGIAIGLFANILVALPILMGLQNLKPSDLLSSFNQSFNLPFSSLIFSSLPALVFFYFLSLWASHSFKIGSLFFFSFFILGFLLFFLISKILNLRIETLKFQSTALNWAFRSIKRNKATAAACFLSIGLGSTLLNIIPQIESSLQNELKSPQSSKLPALFMFDIQEDQVSTIQKILSSKNLSFSKLSPMIRSRLTHVNGIPFNRGKGANSDSNTREEEEEMRFRNRGFNLSYMDKISSEERIIKGLPFNGKFNHLVQKIPFISLEKRFAERLDLKIGDQLSFDIESVTVKGKVHNLRSINWTSFQPNFFIQFQKGALDDAPKTFVASVPNLSAKNKSYIQKKIVEEVPNVSIIDVSRLVQRLLKIIEQMKYALGFMAILCLVVGLIVIYSIANHQASSKSWETGLLKALGANFSLIRKQFIYQFTLISLVASFFGAFFSLLISYFITTLIFDNQWTPNFIVPIFSVVGIGLLTVLLSLIATQSALKKPTRELFI